MDQRESIDECIVANAVHQLSRRLCRPVALPVCEWAEANIDLSPLKSGASEGLIRLYPYQREVLEASDDRSVQEVTIMMGQRMGKSQIWKIALVKHLHDGRCSAIVVYPSLELGKKTNEDEVIPLISELREVSDDMRQRGNIRRDSMHLPSLSSVIYFLGGGAQVVSLTANFCVLDECDFIELPSSSREDDQNIDQLRAIRLRMKTYRDKMLIACSSPSLESGPIYRNWLEGSRGTWSMRCLSCGELSPCNRLAFPLGGGRFAGLQWEKTDDGVIIPDSIRWICPRCGHAHTEADAMEMNARGAYVHQRPSETRHRSFQVGALGNPALWSWMDIAKAQESATDIIGRKAFRNSVLGMPYSPRRASTQEDQTLTSIRADATMELPTTLPRDAVCVTMGIDQQSAAMGDSKYYVYAVRAWCDNGDSYLMEAGAATTIGRLAEVLEGRYCGIPVTMAMLDAGGFADNATRTDPLVWSHRNIVYWKGGDSRTLSLADGTPWRWSENIKYMALCSAKYYQVRLLDLMYGPKREGCYRFSYNPSAPPEYFQQIGAVQPNMRLHDGRGDSFATWTSGSQRRDYFDAEKMGVAALDIALGVLPSHLWPRGRIPAFLLAGAIGTANRSV